jgi:hypothetical protein
MSRGGEHDDVDSHGVSVDWKTQTLAANIPNHGSFGTVYDGKLALEQGGYMDGMLSSRSVWQRGGNLLLPCWATRSGWFGFASKDACHMKTPPTL